MDKILRTTPVFIYFTLGIMTSLSHGYIPPSHSLGVKLNESVQQEIHERLMGFKDSGDTNERGTRVKRTAVSRDDQLWVHTNERGTRVKRTAVSRDDQLWVDGNIPYTLSADIRRDVRLTSVIRESMAHMMNVTCLRFVEHDESNMLEDSLNSGGKYAKFIRNITCEAKVGVSDSTGPQYVSIDSNCAQREMIIHELGHVLGLWHEHARYDRDSHVIILWTNIPEVYRHNFIKQPDTRLISPYDLSSMMHYNLKTFAANGENVIKALEEDLEFLIGYRSEMSFYDSFTLNSLYNCSDRCGRNVPLCENGGYVDKNCRCVCPKLLSGIHCESIETDPECGGRLELGYWPPRPIYSPGYPDHYPPVLDCRWLLKSPANTIMTLTVEDLDVEEREDEETPCKDWLEIRYHYIGIDQGPRLCGSLSELKKTEYRSTTSRMIISFRTNSYKTGRGFRATVKVVPQQNCASDPCKNGASCTDIKSTEGFFCNCLEGWVGRHCERQILDGRWTQWSAWSGCVAECGRESRSRTCIPPINGGRECSGSALKSRACANDRRLCRGSFRCDFGTASDPSDCGVVQETIRDTMDWDLGFDGTPSGNTGPSRGHTTGQSDDRYMYLEASLGSPKDNAIFWVPARKWKAGRYCLEFFYHMYGASVGSLRVVRKTRHSQSVLWQLSGDQGETWHGANINILMYREVTIGFESIKGDTYQSDIAVDDVSISPRGCHDDDEMVSDQPVTMDTNFLDAETWRLKRLYNQTVCILGKKNYQVGDFWHELGKCKIQGCFCNQDGNVDCPEWNTTNPC